MIEAQAIVENENRCRCYCKVKWMFMSTIIWEMKHYWTVSQKQSLVINWERFIFSIVCTDTNVQIEGSFWCAEVFTTLCICLYTSLHYKLSLWRCDLIHCDSTKSLLFQGRIYWYICCDDEVAFSKQVRMTKHNVIVLQLYQTRN